MKFITLIGLWDKSAVILQKIIINTYGKDYFVYVVI